MSASRIYLTETGFTTDTTKMRSREPLKLSEYQKFEMICKYQKKNVEETLDWLMGSYNKKYEEDYKKSLEDFWNT